MTRLCVRCRRAPSIEDGRECAECVLETLRETRAHAATSTWRRRVEDPVAMGATSGIGRDWTGATRSAA